MEKFETNKIYCGDCLDVMRKIPDNSIDLVYLDPPFFSNDDYEIIWGDEAELKAYTDRWAGDISKYTLEMSNRLEQIQRILKNTGTVYLHCNWNASHRLRCELDKHFGLKNFKTEIIWQRREEARGMQKHTFFPIVSDTILVYSKTNNFTYHEQLHNYSEKFLNSFKLDDSDGKGLYRWMNLTRNYNPDSIKDKETKIGGTGILYYKDFLSVHVTGSPITNIWADIPNGLTQKEKLHYPTQKPETLLERIISASSNEGDIVLDPFSGGGTTISVAKKLKRKFVGIDISQTACGVAAQRINYTDYIEGVKISSEVLQSMNPWQFQQFVCDRMSAVNTSKSKNTASGGDGGADGVVRIKDEPGLFSGSEIYKKYNGALLQVKQSGAGINVVKNLYATLHSNNKKLGFIVAYNFPKTAFEEAANFKLEHDTDIRLIEVEKLCDPKFNPFT